MNNFVPNYIGSGIISGATVYVPMLTFRVTLTQVGSRMKKPRDMMSNVNGHKTHSFVYN